MMLGQYVIHLYCQNMLEDAGNADRHAGMNPALEIAGQNRREACARARKAGWKLDLRRGQAWCPRCVKPAVAQRA